eukprot:193542-Alexandrium_andersonii.AAC.1
MGPVVRACGRPQRWRLARRARRPGLRRGAQAAWAAVSRAKVRGPQACRRKAPVPPGRVPPGADSAEAWRASADEAWGEVEAWARTLPAAPP